MPEQEQVVCPNCGSEKWNAVEQYHSLTMCQIFRDQDGVAIEFDLRSEHVRDAATSVILAYTCSNEVCGYTIAANELQ